MKIYLVVLAGVIMGCCMSSQTAYGASSSQEFVRQLSIHNIFEIESSRLALDKSRDKNVRSYARHIINDAAWMGNGLNKALSSARPALKNVSELDNRHKAMLSSLQNASGDAFNEQFIAGQIDMHKAVISLLQQYIDSGKDPALKRFAIDALPAVRDQLNEIEDIKKKTMVNSFYRRPAVIRQCMI